jgi:hypothetical protein
MKSISFAVGLLCLFSACYADGNTTIYECSLDGIKTVSIPDFGINLSNKQILEFHKGFPVVKGNYKVFVYRDS